MSASPFVPHSAAEGRRALVVSLHDVSPQTRGACAVILGALAALGVPRCSLLVIPDHHRRGHFLADAACAAWLRAQAAAGHELVMHGYYHERARRDGESVGAKLTTRIYTADEGEFFDLERAQAAALVEKARADFRQLGVEPAGFIAPAWLLSAEAEETLRELGCGYTTRLGSGVVVAIVKWVVKKTIDLVFWVPSTRHHSSQIL